MAELPHPALPSSVTAPKTSIRLADPPFNDPDGEIIIRTSDNVDFSVFKCFLGYSSHVFKDMFLLPQQAVKDDLKDGKPIIHTTETADIWKTLLAFSYPMWAADPPVLDSLEEVLSVLESSKKYMMEGVEKKIRAALVSPRFVEAEPVRVFAIACHHRLDAEARIAARQTLRLPILGRPYIPELEHITAGVHHRLQEYHQQCGKVASKVASDLGWIARESFVWLECNECKGQRNSTSATLSMTRRVWVVSKWWLEYLTSATAALMERPAGATVVSPVLMDEALGKASRCTNCRTRAFADMREFGALFAAEVDRVTSEVSFFFLPGHSLRLSEISLASSPLKIVLGITL
jgi:hypothetical protein